MRSRPDCWHLTPTSTAHCAEAAAEIDAVVMRELADHRRRQAAAGCLGHPLSRAYRLCLYAYQGLTWEQRREIAVAEAP